VPARAVIGLPWLLGRLAGLGRSDGSDGPSRGRALGPYLCFAVFIPAIVDLEDAVTEALAVRKLSFTDGGPLRLLPDELGTGGLLGLALAALSFVAVSTVFGDPRLSLAVAFALAAAGTIATRRGFRPPWASQRAGLDPALGSGPVATVVQDVLSLAVSLGLVGLLLT